MKRMKKLLCMLVVLSLMIISMSQDTFAAIKINKSSITLNKSQSYSLKISGTKKSVSWTSSNTSVATVTSKGVVKAKKKGTCKITAKVGKTKYYCDVVVKQPVTDIELSKKNISLSKGKSIKLNVTVTPVSANNKKIIWSSSNSKVARVSADGVVTAVKKGEVTITAKSLDGSNKKATCKVKVTESTNKSEVKDGIYIIESAVNSNYVIDVEGKKTDDGANIHIWQKNSSNNQCFIIKKVTGDYYKIIAKHSGKAVDVCGGSKEPNINIWQWSWNGTNAQLWKFISAGNGYYYIQNKNGMYLDLYGANASNGTNIWTCQGNKTNAQKWKLVASNNKTEVLDGSYKISTALNSSMYLDVCGISTDNCANIHLWSNNNDNNQKFYIVNEENEYYKIIAAHSGKAVDVEGGGSTPQTNVWQYEWNGTNAQLWKFISAGNGYYYIQNKNGLYLDAACGESQNGTNVWGYTLNKSLAQKWKLTATKVEQNKNTGIRLQHHMNSSLRQGDYNQFNQPYGYNAGCCAMAYATGLSIIMGCHINPTQYWYGGLTHYDSGRVGGYVSYNTNQIYSSLTKGKPTMLHYKYAGNSGEHWVLVIGVRNGVNISSINYDDLIIIDPATGTECSLNNAYKFSGATVCGMKLFQ